MVPLILCLFLLSELYKLRCFLVFKCVFLFVLAYFILAMVLPAIKILLVFVVKAYIFLFSLFTDNFYLLMELLLLFE